MPFFVLVCLFLFASFLSHNPNVKLESAASLLLRPTQLRFSLFVAMHPEELPVAGSMVRSSDFGTQPCKPACSLCSSSYYFYTIKKELRKKFPQKLAHKDSNLEMTESESVALPFGDGPMSYQQMTLYIHGIAVSRSFCKNFL